MHILTGSHRFRARETSGGYKHPHQVEGLVPPRFIPGESPSYAAVPACHHAYVVPNVHILVAVSATTSASHADAHCAKTL